MVMESDTEGVKHIVEQALVVGIRNFVFSVAVGSLSNRAVISHLLLWCTEAIRRKQGQLLFVEKNDGEKCVFGSLCESLHIPIYQNLDTAILTSDSAKPHESDA